MSRGLGGMLVAAMFLAQPISAAASGPSASGIVGSVVKAPISPDGDVAGALTDFVINLAGDMDPSVPGRVLDLTPACRAAHSSHATHCIGLLLLTRVIPPIRSGKSQSRQEKRVVSGCAPR